MFERVIWNGWFRVLCFWAIVVGLPVAADLYFGFLDFLAVGNAVWNAVATAGSAGNATAIGALSKPDFALQLAAGLGVVGAGFLV